MEADAGGRVEVEVGVVDHVQPPQQRHGVEHHVLKVDDKVQCHDREGHGEPGRYADVIEEPPAPAFGEQGQTDHPEGCEEARGQRVKGDQTQVAEPAPGRPTVSRRRGASASHRAISSNAPPKQPRRTADS